MDDGLEQLQQASEREFRLGFHTGCAEEAKVGGTLGGPIEERRLTDPRFASKNEDGAPAAARVLQQLAEALSFSIAPDQHA